MTDRLAGVAPNMNSMPSLRVALLGYRSHPFVGGQGIYLKYLSRALAALGHQVTVFSGQPYPQLDEGVTLVKVSGLNLYESDAPFKALKWANLASKADTIEWLSKMTGGFGEPYSFGKRVKKLIKPGQFDIIHDNQGLFYSLLALQKHTPVISTIHHPIHRDRELALDDAPNLFHRLMRMRWYSFLTMQEKVVSRLRFVTTVSKQSQQDISTFFNRDSKNCIYIPNGIDTRLFAPDANVTKIPYQLITTTSSDQPLKGLRFLLLALHALTNRFPKTKLIIIGQLNPDGKCASLIKNLQLTDNIQFESQISTQRLVELYRESCVAVCPSLYEGFGLPAAEAMACGCAVVTSDGGALPEVVGDAGITVKAGDTKALENALSTLFMNEDERLRLERLARERVLRLFSWEKVASALTCCYLHILQQKNFSPNAQKEFHQRLLENLSKLDNHVTLAAARADD